MTNDEIKKTCTCGNPDETHVSMHSGLCPVWAVHHKLIVK